MGSVVASCRSARTDDGDGGMLCDASCHKTRPVELWSCLSSCRARRMARDADRGRDSTRSSPSLQPLVYPTETVLSSTKLSTMRGAARLAAFTLNPSTQPHPWRRPHRAQTRQHQWLDRFATPMINNPKLYIAAPCASCSTDSAVLAPKEKAIEEATACPPALESRSSIPQRHL